MPGGVGAWLVSEASERREANYLGAAINEVSEEKPVQIGEIAVSGTELG